MKKLLFSVLVLLILAFAIASITKGSIGSWKRDSKFPIEVTIYKNHMNARWVHSDATLIFNGFIKDNSFYGHLSSDSSLPNSNQATILADGSLEAHFLKESNAIFEKD